MVQKKEYDIAIVGCGASAVVFLRSIFENIVFSKTNRLKIIVFERSLEFGVGEAYQDDLDNLLINRPLQTMSAHPTRLNEFESWLESNKNILNDYSIELGKSRGSYVSRKIFGMYLKDVLSKIKINAEKIGSDIELIRGSVCDIEINKNYELILEDGNRYCSNHIILCTGNNKPSDIYKLDQTKNYIESPYPLYSKLKMINPKSNVAILGSSLTAIDVALSLQSLKHSGNISIISRKYAVPRVRGDINNHDLIHFNMENLYKIKNQKGSISLRDALRLFRKELNEVNACWKDVLSESMKDKKYANILDIEIKSASQTRKWQSVLASTNKVIEFCWNSFDDNSKNVFIEKFNRLWLNSRSPIPEVNAKKLLGMIKVGELEVHHSINSIQYDSIGEKYCISFDGDIKKEFDWIVNATGPSRHVDKKDKLLYQLIQKGILSKNEFGGLDVDFKTSSVIDKNYNINYKIRLLGHNTVGVYGYTSSLEMIAKKARYVAIDILNRLK